MSGITSVLPFVFIVDLTVFTIPSLAVDEVSAQDTRHSFIA